jgi:RNA polymerase sigma factor (sigma-70 family)
VEKAIQIQSPGQLSKNKIIEDTVKTESKRLFGFIRNRVKTNEEAEDLLQDVFYQFAASFDIVEPIEKISAWLFTVARNKITDFYRKKKTIPFSSMAKPSAENEDDGLLFMDTLFADTDNAEDQMLTDLIWETLEEALDELPEKQRQVFQWHELEGKSFREIAKSTGEQENTLISRKRYAVLHLRNRLKDLYETLLTN